MPKESYDKPFDSVGFLQVVEELRSDYLVKNVFLNKKPQLGYSFSAQGFHLNLNRLKSEEINLRLLKTGSRLRLFWLKREPVCLDKCLRHMIQYRRTPRRREIRELLKIRGDLKTAQVSSIDRGKSTDESLTLRMFAGMKARDCLDQYFMREMHTDLQQRAQIQKDRKNYGTNIDAFYQCQVVLAMKAYAKLIVKTANVLRACAAIDTAEAS